MRLIDADEAIINFGFEWNDIPPTREEFVRFLKKQPTVDAVPVVRCKDCLNGTFCLNSQGAEYVDCMLDDYSVRKPDDFCSYGERKEGADNG